MWKKIEKLTIEGGDYSGLENNGMIWRFWTRRVNTKMNYSKFQNCMKHWEQSTGSKWVQNKRKNSQRFCLVYCDLERHKISDWETDRSVTLEWYFVESSYLLTAY